MELPIRKPNRLDKYDYSRPGSYFVTICCEKRSEILWRVGATCGRPLSERYTKYGIIIDAEINNISNVYDNVVIDEYIIMPNHVHMIIIIKNCCYDDGRPKVAPTLSRIIQQFKGAVTKKCNFLIWEKSFYDHIINNGFEYQKIQNYIKSNPENWQSDCFYHQN